MKELEMIELVGSIGRKVMKHFKTSAATQGMSASEGLTLWHLRRFGNCKVSDLAGHLTMSPSTLTGVLDRLEAGGWITRGTDPEDRRAVTISSTAKLAAFVETAKISISQDLERTFKDFPPDFLDGLCRDLSRVLAALEREEKKDQ